jgi:hypothetical protein
MVRPVTITQNTQHVTQGQALPIYDLRKPKLQALLASYLQQVQDAENAAYSLYVGLLIFSATGDALDMLGDLVGQPRDGRSDAVYRVWIEARARVLRSNGKPEEILGIIRLVLDPSASVTLLEFVEATIRITLIGTTVTPILATQVAELVRHAKAQGITLDMAYSPIPATDVFTLGDSATWSASSTTKGMADTALTTGGKLTGAV